MVKEELKRESIRSKATRKAWGFEKLNGDKKESRRR